MNKPSSFDSEFNYEFHVQGMILCSKLFLKERSFEKIVLSSEKKFLSCVFFCKSVKIVAVLHR